MIRSFGRCLFTAVFFLVLSAAFISCGSSAPVHPLVQEKDGKVIIPLSEVNDGKVHFYTFKKSGKKTNFFVRTDSSGKVDAYFDACFTCYKHKKGYRVEGSDLVCNECGMHFPIAAEQWDNSQGCSPILLKSTIDNGQLVMDTELLKKGSKLF